MKDIQELAPFFGVIFRDPALIEQAFVHRSYLNEHPNFPLGHNERLEFLGDAILELVVTEYLYTRYPQSPEGELTNWRAALVNANMLSHIASEIGFDAYLYLSRGEAKESNSRARRYILANAIEAVIGALYLDQGMPCAKRFIEQHILSHLQRIIQERLYQDSKSRFQEKAQELHGITPHYQVLQEVGPDHAKSFTVGIYVDKDLIASGQGPSKQEAETEAAEKALAVKGW